MKTLRILLLVVLAFALGVSCFWLWLTYPSRRERDVRLPMPTNIVWLDTGLSPDDQVIWHHLSEGSEAIPMSVLEALKSPKTGKPFLYSLADYGFMLESEEPHHLPIGWTVQLRDLGGRDVPFVGINCAGCHTGELRYNGRTVRIDGAPNLYQLEAFFVDLREAIATATTNRLDSLLFLRRVIRMNHRAEKEQDFLSISKEALARLDQVNEDDSFGTQGAQGPLGEPGHPGHRPVRKIQESSTASDLLAELLASLTRDGSYLDRRLRALRTLAKAIDSGVDLGPGRGDSFGIIRRLLWPFDHIPLDAPVSTPHLFNFAGYKWIHWDGNTQSVMQRNIAQAIALGADFDPGTFQSSVLPYNLHQLELTAHKLKPPAWPEAILGTIDRTQAARGKSVYDEHCAGCHSGERVFTLEEVKTSPVRATNFARRLGRRSFPDSLGAMASFAETALFRERGISPEQAQQLEIPDPEWRATKGYQARSLAGIWATPPYLHNGSVPTLYDLLQPPAKRQAKFAIGHRDYDPKKLGYVTEVAHPIFILDATLDGNRNIGHEFGTDLPEPSKWDLLEYLKTL